MQTENRKIGEYVISDEMQDIIDLCAPLEDELDELRKIPNVYRSDTYARIRELRIIIGKNMKKYWEISEKLNPKWHAQNPVWKKKFKS